MDTTQQPPHRTTTTTATDLFTCFTSRHRHNHHSSSSTTKMSPSNPPTSLTASLSRRLKTNRSIKGSPALFSTTKKRFDNPEPSSPKVTCIGQVKIKSKKKARKNKRVFVKSSSFSSSTNENQKWVHLPLTICEGLRSFGSEFSCLFPCFSPPEKEYSGDRRSSGSCAAVCTRWLVVDDCGRSGGGRRRDMELVVSDHEEVDDVSISRVSRRHHVFDDLKIVNNNIVEGNDQCTSSSRFSICVPPKNALLLMRCRSDPLKMEALANRLWDSTISQNDDSDDNEDNEQDDDDDDDDDELVQNEQFEYVHEIQEMHEIQELEHNIEHNMDPYKEQILETNNEKDDECTFFGSLFDENVDQVQGFEENLNQDQEFEENVDQENESNTEKVNGCEGINDEESKEIDNLPECLLLMMCEPKLSMEVSKETWVSSKDFFRRNSSRKKPPPAPVPVKSTGGQVKSKVSATSSTKANFQNGINFDNLTAAPSAVQPGRSSCSLPVAPSMAEMLEHKLVNAVGYEPFVLTRCKSEPMRTAADKLAPDSCFWKNRKLEPRRASFGVKLGATEVETINQIEAKDRGFAVSVLGGQLSASNSLCSISLVLCSLIGAMIGKSADDLLASSFIFGDTSKSTNSIKYVAILSCFILAFACFIQTTRHLVHASFLISIPTYKPTGNPTAKPNGKPVDPLECIQKAVLRGSNFWAAGLRALYFATTLILWIFGPIPMLVGSVATVMILHFLDLHYGDYIPFDQNTSNGNGHLLVNKSDQDSTHVVVDNGRYNEMLRA